jgi:hypothetical protein
VSLGTDASGRRVRRSRTFDSRTQAEAWIATQQLEHRQLTNPVTEDRLADYLRWWLAVEAPKGKPGRRPLARTTLAHYRVVVEHHLIPELGHRKVGQLTVRELDAFASRRLAAGYAPATVNRMRETLRSALSTAVRQDRLIRNVARYGGGVAAAVHPSTGSPTTSSRCCSRPPATSTSSRSSCCWPAPACGSGRPAGCAGATSTCSRFRRG